MTFDLPATPQTLERATWDDLAPFYEVLATVPLTLQNAEEWLHAWSRLQAVVDEAGTLAMIAYTCDTADSAKEEANLRWSSEISPKVNEQSVRLAQRLVAVGWTRDDMSVVIREFRTDIEIFREANVEIFSEIEEHSAAYQKITGGLSAEWDGERVTIPQLQPHLKERDRAVRERAFRLGAAAYLDRQVELAALFDKMFALRQRVATNAGFANHMDYCFKAKHRFDYSPDDCARFHAAVEATAAPAVERLMAHRREALGVDVLRPWDTLVQLESERPVRPFADRQGFVEPATRIFDALDPELGAQFREMATAGLLDLESRPGKAPGGYCTKLTWRGKPFIFMNAVGVPDDVNTLVHEAGHSFHDFAAHRQPLIWQRGVGHEAAELASMSMELLAMPHLQQPVGYYSSSQARAVEIEQLEDVLSSLVHIASVDAFQRWIYTSGQGHDAAARDDAWLVLRSRFERGVDWSGLERERVARWYRQLHIFELPFYYIEYGIAQLGALQLWRDSMRDPAGTMQRYKHALSLGGTRSLPDIYAAAGARLIFDTEGMAELVALVEARIHAMRQSVVA
ncbi:MAG: M3 family oligoendopeptidase [Gemmatimonadaceae bacterium]|nr:M3 family oligoendopeptidase [Gemmatimonadaceae bacterium]